MPIYEYQCDSCSHELEKLQKMSEADPIDCPQCDEPALKRMVSAAAFRLKGSGWYETDFKKDNKRNLADAGDKKSAAKDGKKQDKSEANSVAKKADSKPAAKTAAKQ